MFDFKLFVAVNRYFSKASVSPAKRNEHGEMVIEPPKLMQIGNRVARIGTVVSFLMLIILFWLWPESELRSVLKAFSGLLFIILGFIWLVVPLQEVTVNDATITSKRWGRTTTMAFQDIKQVSASHMGGIYVIIIGKKKIDVSLEYCGSFEFVDVLVQKLGHERCAAAIGAVNKKREKIDFFLSK